MAATDAPEQENKPNKRGVAPLVVILVVCLLVAVGGGGYMLTQYLRAQEGLARQEETPVPEEVEPEEELPANPIDFGAVKVDTPEAYARAMLYPERERPVAMPTRRIVDTQPEYRPQSAMNMQPAMAAPVLTPERETFAPSYAAPSYAAPAYAEPAYAEPQAPVSPISVQETYAVPEYADEAAEAYAEEENEDLAPTATTIQYRTEQRARDDKRTLVEEKRGHAMTTQGKLLMAIYAVVVVVILALIIINTSVLRNLDASIAENRAALFAATEQAQQLQDEIDYLTSEESIIDRAESELGMVRG